MSCMGSHIKKHKQDLYKFSVEEIDMKISCTSHGIRVTWKTEDKNKEPRCYISELQYKNQCVKNWTSELTRNEELTVVDLPTLSMKHNYDFRIRMKLDCMYDGDWSNWTTVQSWGNNTGVCKVESSSNLSIWIYVLITALPMTAFLLICLMMQEGIRKLILPVVPDPKHFKSKFMDIDQSQWWGNLGQHTEECTTTEIEIVNKSEDSEDDQTVVIESMDATLERDNMYCIYSSETPDEITQQYSQRVCGYVVL
ncbi:cytokine receptor-like factor 2 isoform X2 [Triplophysa rosa]|uniref:cytokine receptor-like factor 2 isoform X2 n=1 Tax=Triplophysa rosa TaxID=992332 RepID=UPI002545CA74|nr:cytokine receptor-like factor 2 isoform X2 [Triplophysa rosa]XP_057192106.1 cytokine receptor-like factor 2 isoform X2 [Triplophysa rosa]XP_057192107.1 cytokine receptor-like factor 2 isoform X2 [Triplophysa rosa]